MGLRLRDVPAVQGWRWTIAGLATWRRQALAFTVLFLTFMVGVMLVASLVPLAGGAVGTALMPLASLGFMVATRGALRGERPRLSHLVEGWRGADAARRRAQVTLAVGYALGAVLVFSSADLIDGGAFDRWQRENARSGPAIGAGAPRASGPGRPAATASAPPPSAGTAGSVGDEARREDGGAQAGADTGPVDARLLEGLALRMGLGALLAIPFWHAPALVHWAGHGAGQALFASTLAVWRARGAFVVFAAAWSAMAASVSIVLVVLARLVGLGALAGMLGSAAVMALSAAFYASLWFTFADSFDAGADPESGTGTGTGTGPPAPTPSAQADA